MISCMSNWFPEFLVRYMVRDEVKFHDTFEHVIDSCCRVFCCQVRTEKNQNKFENNDGLSCVFLHLHYVWLLRAVFN